MKLVEVLAKSFGSSVSESVTEALGFILRLYPAVLIAETERDALCQAPSRLDPPSDAAWPTDVFTDRRHHHACGIYVRRGHSNHGYCAAWSLASSI